MVLVGVALAIPAQLAGQRYKPRQRQRDMTQATATQAAIVSPHILLRMEPVGAEPEVQGETARPSLALVPGAQQKRWQILTAY